MKKLSALIIFALVMTAAPGVTMAEESFRTEVEFGYSYLESDLGGEADIFSLAARYHFMPVTTIGRPLAESAFMARAGFVEVFLSDADLEFGAMNADQDIYGVELLWRKPATPYAFRFIYSEEDQKAPGGQKADLDETGLGVGYFLAENLYLEFAYLHEEVEATGSYTGESDQYELSGKYVGACSSSRFYNIEASISQIEYEDKTPFSWKGDDVVFTLAGDYYFDEKLSFGLGYLNESGDVPQFEGQEYSVRVRYFVVPKVSVGVEYAKFDPENSFIRADEEETSIVLAGRF